MSDFLCPECKGSGEYRGLNTVEPCRACGGKIGKSVIEYAAECAGISLAPDALQFAIPEIHFTLTPTSTLSFQAETGAIDNGVFIEYFPTGYRTLHMEGVSYQPEQVELICNSLIKRERVNLVCHLPDGTDMKITGTVGDIRCFPEVQEAAITIEQGPADA